MDNFNMSKWVQDLHLKEAQIREFDTDNVDLLENTRINLKDFKSKELKNIYMVNSN